MSSKRIARRSAVALVVLAFLGSGASQTSTSAQEPLAAEQPAASNDFLNSIAVNTHFDQYPYDGPQFPTIAHLLETSGIKHIRESTVTNPAYIARLNLLAHTGIRSTIITSVSDSDNLIRSFPHLIPDSFEAYDGPNEYNASKNPNWVPTLKAFMIRLHEDVKGDGALTRYPILAPALIGGLTAARELGSLDSIVDFGNTHDYYSSFNPGTTGWGSHTPVGVYGSLAYNMGLARVVAPTKPVIATETGYGSTPTGGPGNVIDDVTAGKYIPRLLFLQFNAGVYRTFIYEFLNKDDSGGLYTNFGLVDTALRPKPAYRVLKALIANLADPTLPPNRLSPLSYRLIGASDDICHSLLERPDGTYELALWREVEGWKNGNRFDVPAKLIRLVTTRPLSSATALYFASDGTPTTSELALTASHDISVEVTDQVSLIHLIFR